MILRSKRLNNNEIEFSIHTEDILRRILGETMLSIHGKHNNTKWIKILIRLIKALEKAFENNFYSDGFHSSRIKQYFESIKASTSTSNNEEIEIIICLICIIFELLGCLPDNRGRKILNSKDEFILNGMKELNYKQSPSQKVNTILEASKFKPYSDSHNFNDLINIYYDNFNGNSLLFLKWYKETYSKEYLMLF